MSDMGCLLYIIGNTRESFFHFISTFPIFNYRQIYRSLNGFEMARANSFTYEVLYVYGSTGQDPSSQPVQSLPTLPSPHHRIQLSK